MMEKTNAVLAIEAAERLRDQLLLAQNQVKRLIKRKDPSSALVQIQECISGAQGYVLALLVILAPETEVCVECRQPLEVKP